VNEQHPAWATAHAGLSVPRDQTLQETVMKNALLIATLLLLCGCAGSYTQPVLSVDHPANPTAPESPPLRHGQTLDLAAADPVTPALAAKPTDHAGHQRSHKSQPEAATSGVDTGTPKHDAPASTSAGVELSYVCPMHPEVTSDKPNQRCPKCGMKLEPKAEAGGPR
jgi:hypothetical protein